jgi:enoyl-CoA hydratase/carnithine racemase
MATTSLFTVPILTNPASKTAEPVGTFICTSSQPGVYVLTFNSPPDNRLTTAFCQSFLLALDIIEFSYPPGVVVTTSAIPKFYSNGLDLEHAKITKGFWTDSLYALFKRLATYPMPTIALINGHVSIFASALICDDILTRCKRPLLAV